MKKGTIRIVCISYILLVVTVCIRDRGKRPDQPERMTIFHGSSEWLMGPSADNPPKFLMFLPLAHYPDWCSKKKTIGLAERWEHSSDYKIWTFYLRKGILWHDGVPVTARDIAFSIDLWKHPDVRWYGGAPIESLAVIDDHTIELTFENPGQALTFMDWYAFYPEHLLRSFDPKKFFKWEFWTRPIGNGPYRYSRHIPGTMMEFTANPDYYRGKPPIETLVIKLGSQTPAVNELLSGGADIVEVDPALGERIAADNESFRVFYGDPGGPVRLVWHLHSPLFKDREVRRALTLAIDRTLLFDLYKIPTDLPITEGPYSRCAYLNGNVPQGLPYDSQGAEILLAQAGWLDEDGDGIREKDGRSFLFTTIVPPAWQKAAVVVQDQLQRIGVKMEIQQLEYNLVVQRFFSGNFEAALPRVADVDYQIGLRGANGYENPRLHQLLELLSNTFLQEERDRMSLKIAAIYKEDLPGTFLFPRPGPTFLVHRRIRGFEDWSNDWLRLDQLWIEEER